LFVVVEQLGASIALKRRARPAICAAVELQAP
jgi:hypothetical protein